MPQGKTTSRFDCPVHKPGALLGIPAERCTCMHAEDRGLEGRYQVRRLDGKPIGECFVLAETDPYAAAALATYAEACAERYPQLSADLKDMVARWLKP
jgi:hypothetical protein